MKRRFYFWAKKNLTAENIYSVILLIPLSAIIWYAINGDIIRPIDFLDIDVVITFFAITVCNVIAHALLSFIEKRCEDSAKLTGDYAKLLNQYKLEACVDYKGIKIPVVPLFMRRLDEPWSVCIKDDPTRSYALPVQIALRAKSLMQAHSQSAFYNQICVRLEDVCTDPIAQTVTFYTGRTTYYNSMVTNRACDYEIEGEVSVRNLYEPGPYLQPLSQASVSNHLGFNGFIRTVDGKIPFILRSDNLSIGKGTLGNSIGASLKTKYCLNESDNYKMSVDTLGYAVLREIIDELSLEKEANADAFIRDNADKGFNVNAATNGIFAIYRDLLECGKPQFLFFMDLKIHSAEIEKLFLQNDNSKKRDSIQDSVRKDGKKILFFTIDELKQAKITAGTFEINGKRYPMLPSASASVAMLLMHFD